MRTTSLLGFFAMFVFVVFVSFYLLPESRADTASFDTSGQTVLAGEIYENGTLHVESIVRLHDPVALDVLADFLKNDLTNQKSNFENILIRSLVAEGVSNFTVRVEEHSERALVFEYDLIGKSQLAGGLWEVNIRPTIQSDVFLTLPRNTSIEFISPTPATREEKATGLVLGWENVDETIQLKYIFPLSYWWIVVLAIGIVAATTVGSLLFRIHRLRKRLPKIKLEVGKPPQIKTATMWLVTLMILTTLPVQFCTGATWQETWNKFQEDVKNVGKSVTDSLSNIWTTELEPRVTVIKSSMESYVSSMSAQVQTAGSEFVQKTVEYAATTIQPMWDETVNQFESTWETTYKPAVSQTWGAAIEEWNSKYTSVINPEVQAYLIQVKDVLMEGDPTPGKLVPNQLKAPVNRAVQNEVFEKVIFSYIERITYDTEKRDLVVNLLRGSPFYEDSVGVVTDFAFMGPTALAYAPVIGSENKWFYYGDYFAPNRGLTLAKDILNNSDVYVFGNREWINLRENPIEGSTAFVSSIDQPIVMVRLGHPAFENKLSVLISPKSGEQAIVLGLV